MKVTVYTQPACMGCRATIRKLKGFGIDHEVIDVTKDPEALALIKALGYTAAPVVVAGDSHWSGFKPDNLAALAYLAADQHAGGAS